MVNERDGLRLGARFDRPGTCVSCCSRQRRNNTTRVPMAELKDTKIPKDVQEKGSTVIGITDEFCLTHLDAKYAQLCRNVVGKLARKRPSPLLRGGLRIRASGVIYAMASQKFLLDPSQPMHLSAQQLGDLPDVEKTAMGNKAPYGAQPAEDRDDGSRIHAS